jgi:hypothetical protein
MYPLHEGCPSFLSHVHLPKFVSHNCFLVNANKHLSCNNTAPILIPKEAYSKMKILVKFGITKIRIVQIVFLKAYKVFSVASFQKKALFFSKEVNGATILP